jgi:S-DNA-T family DNA segregation ATPase FtsK/SpoIIIE
MEVYGLLLTGFAVLLLLSLVSFDPRDVALDYRLRSGEVQNLIGPVGAHAADLLFSVLGLTSLIGVSTFFYFGGLLLAGRRPVLTGVGLTNYINLTVLSCVIAHIILGEYRPFAHTPGGLIGEWTGEIMRTLFATPGTLIIAISLLGASVLSLSGLSAKEIARLPVRLVNWATNWTFHIRDRGTSTEASEDEPMTKLGKRADDTSDKRRFPRFRDAFRARQANESAPSAEVEETTPPHQIVENGPPIVEAERYEARQPTVQKDGEPDVTDVDPPRRKTAAPAAPQKLKNKTIETSTNGGKRATQKKSETATATPGKPEAFTPKRAKSGTSDDVPKTEAEPPASEIEIAEPLANTGPVIIEEQSNGAMPMVGDQKSLDFGGPRIFEFPSMSLLQYEPPARTAVDKEALSQAAVTLEQKLGDFGVKGQVVKIQPGPVVTMFEFLPAPGIKISKITNLTDDLTMALHAQRVRIVAPIPGKGVVGIEVPSRIRETVFLKEILASKEFQESRAKLPVSLGKDIVGKPMVADLAKAPHLLVAGSTGSGKSVAVNAFIMSLLYRHKPSDLRMILVDPKMLELSVYDDIPHLLLPVVTDPSKASLALKWAVGEMERRYRLLAACAVRNITGFNAKVEKYKSGERKPPEQIAEDELEHLPYIVIILDELADLMMVSGKEVEQAIARLAQMARAAGIHLVIATQRPSVDVVTGLIKANFPTRISFMVSSKIDSRTILDGSGAENLLGRGDMLFMPPGTSRLQRCQGCFVSDDEVERVAEHLKKFGPPEYDMNILADDDSDQKDLSKEDYDPLFDQAVAIVCDTRNASISYLQRRLKIGYNRSARIIERMEHDGIISRPDHRGVRKVLAPEAAPE